MDEKMTRIRLLEALSRDRLDAVSDLVHDCWFEPDDITVNQDSHIIEIPYEREVFDDGEIVENGLIRTYRVPIYRCFMVISDVLETSIVDDLRVGRYDFVEIETDATGTVLEIRTGVPLQFRIKVASINITVERSEFPLRYIARKSI